MKDINEQIKKYLEYLENKKKRTSRTVRNYDLYLNRFSSWLEEKGINEVEKIKIEHIKKYKTYLKKIKNPIKKIHLKQNTQNYHLIALREFLEYLNGKNIKSLQKNKVELDKFPKRISRVLSKTEIEELLKAPKKIVQDSIIQYRDLAILDILYTTGARVSEISELKLSDLNIKMQKLVLASGKKNERTFNISNQSKHYFVQYIKLRSDDNEFLFIGHDRANTARESTSLSPRSIERVLIKYGKVVGLEIRVTPQVFRNTYMQGHLIQGTDLEKIKKILGVTSSTPLSRFE